MFKRVLPLLVAGAFGMALAYVLGEFRAGKAPGAFGDTMVLMPGGEIGVVEVTVVDPKGRPVSGAEVSVEDQSATPRGKTDRDGKAWFTPAGRVVVNVGVMGRKVAETNWLRRIDTDCGLKVFYVLKTSVR